MATIQYRNRRTGRLETERVFHGGALRFLYGGWTGRLLGELLASGSLLSWCYGWLQRRPSSKRRIPQFVSSLGVAVEEAERALHEYASLDDFFTRKLKP